VVQHDGPLVTGSDYNGDGAPTSRSALATDKRAVSQFTSA